MAGEVCVDAACVCDDGLMRNGSGQCADVDGVVAVNSSRTAESSATQSWIWIVIVLAIVALLGEQAIESFAMTFFFFSRGDYLVGVDCEKTQTAIARNDRCVWRRRDRW